MKSYLFSVIILLIGTGKLTLSGQESAVKIPGLPESVQARLVLSDSFDRARLTETTAFAGKWRSRDKQVANGHTVDLKEGRLIIKHSPGKHPLIVFHDFAKRDCMRDVAVYARFRLAGEDDGFSIGLNGDNATKGHSRVCGVSVNTTGFGVSDTTGKGKHNRTLVDAEVQPATWHTIYLVIRGRHASVHIDKFAPITLDSAGLGSVKQTVKFGPSKSAHVEVDEIKVWSLD